jgi:hypothetical protein
MHWIYYVPSFARPGKCVRLRPRFACVSTFIWSHSALGYIGLQTIYCITLNNRSGQLLYNYKWRRVPLWIVVVTWVNLVVLLYVYTHHFATSFRLFVSKLAKKKNIANILFSNLLSVVMDMLAKFSVKLRLRFNSTMHSIGFLHVKTENSILVSDSSLFAWVGI